DQSAGDGDSDTSYGEEMDFEITGIEPGAGVFKASEKAVEEYDLEGWEVQASSSGAMATALGEAIDNEEPIIVTGWSPHWKFAKYDVKYLEDTKGVVSEEEIISSMVREDLEEDMPDAYKLLDQFAWTTDDMETDMLDIQDGVSAEDAAASWVEENEDEVAEGTEGGDEVGGEERELVYVEWDS